MAFDAHTTRRSLFATAGATGVAIALPATALATPIPEADAAQFLAWEQERDAYYLQGEHDDASDAETDYWSDRAYQVEIQIHKTPAHSRTAMLVKARQLRIRRQYDLDPHGVEAVDQIIAHLSGAHSDAAPSMMGRA